MKFIVDEKPMIDTREGYVLKIETMIGDADGYESLETGCFKEHELHLLEEVVNVCKAMEKAYPHGRGGDDTYNHVEGFNRWFTEDDEEDYKPIEHLAPFQWAYDSSGWGCQNSIDGYKVVYIKNGYEHKVTILEDEE